MAQMRTILSLFVLLTLNVNEAQACSGSFLSQAIRPSDIHPNIAVRVIEGLVQPEISKELEYLLKVRKTPERIRQICKLVSPHGLAVQSEVNKLADLLMNTLNSFEAFPTASPEIRLTEINRETLAEEILKRGKVDGVGFVSLINVARAYNSSYPGRLAEPTRVLRQWLKKTENHYEDRGSLTSKDLNPELQRLVNLLFENQDPSDLY